MRRGPPYDLNFHPELIAGNGPLDTPVRSHVGLEDAPLLLTWPFIPLGCNSCLSSPTSAGTSTTCTRSRAWPPARAPPAPAAARGSGQKCCFPQKPPLQLPTQLAAPSSNQQSQEARLGGQGKSPFSLWAGRNRRDSSLAH